MVGLTYPITGEEVYVPPPALDIAYGDTGLVKGVDGFEGYCVVNLFDFAEFVAV
ncbi:hypothetical protein [Anaerohalosphaera lusitana]|uniref:hypothetical protein n=1 Tax=Anaerohalosphaera lusitana TaxID=1936003 RepID=UPI0014762F83|nr:hypothetical protein [Anaerohalosphaera lusitana]